MNRFIYSLLLYLLTPFVLLRLLWRSKKAPAYRKRWAERFGFFPAFPRDKPVIWVHSVSVGETIASAPLVKALMKKYPAYRYLITTMTPTGSDRVRAIYGDSVEHIYVPYDLPGAQARFFNKIRPELAIIIETELWPNTIAACKARKIPIIIANARLSERSAKGYKKLGHLTRNLLNQINIIACQNKDDGARFIQLGLPEKNLQVIGSVKFDIDVSKETLVSAQRLRSSWEAGFGKKAQILIAASTHDGEEQSVIDAFIQLKKYHQDLLLVLVPRHPERFNIVYELACNNGLSAIKHSQNSPVLPKTQVILGDTMGEMMKLYAASDIAFVGGSLIERGGHNMLEPAVLGMPVLSGPHVFNFLEISASLKEAGGLLSVSNSQELVTETHRLLENKSLFVNTGNQAKRFVENNRGALERLLNIISRELISRH